MYKAYYKKHILHFNEPGGTSRGVLRDKDSYFLFLSKKNDGIIGIGEFSILPKLSPEASGDPEQLIKDLCDRIVLCQDEADILELQSTLVEMPALRFALEMAFLDLKNGGSRLLYPSDFTLGKDSIPINGLVWMGDIKTMTKRAKQKIEEGFDCIKLKVGAQNFQEELKLIAEIRDAVGDEMIIRVDANGAFSYLDYEDKLDALAKLKVHSIEQPIHAGHAQHMQDVCTTPPLPIALDEELIGYHNSKLDFLRQLKPQYIILKPSLIGGFKECEDWIEAAKDLHIGWWITSALESNIGLSAIAQWTYQLGVTMHQGLGTGQVFSNNIPSPLFIDNGRLHCKGNNHWDLSALTQYPTA